MNYFCCHDEEEDDVNTFVQILFIFYKYTPTELHIYIGLVTPPLL